MIRYCGRLCRAFARFDPLPGSAAIGFVALSLILFWPASGAGQMNGWWKAAGDSLTVDLGPQNRDRKASFADDGLAWESTVSFAMVGKSRVPLVATLPEIGKFEVQIANSAAGVEIRNARSEGGTGRAEIVSKSPVLEFKKLSDAAGDEADQLLKAGRARPEEPAKTRKPREVQFLRSWLTDFAKRRPRWLTAKEPESWSTADAQTLLGRTKELMTYDRAAVALESCGLEVDASVANYRTALEPRLAGVELVLSGKASAEPRDAAAAAKLLSARDLTALRRNFNVKLTCRLIPAANPGDGNAQWFDAQRVTCRAPGASAIRVEGKLHAAGGDRVDWWYLDRFRPGATILSLPKLPGVRWDQFSVEGGVRLRVVALTDEPVIYSFEIHAAEKSSSGKSSPEPSILIYESPNSTQRKFPY